MAAAFEIVTFIFTGADGEDIPRDATHVIIHESVFVIPARTFAHHPNIIEVYCHVGVKIIEEEAFCYCRRLLRVIMPGVRVVEKCAFNYCPALEFVECKKLEKIEERAFLACKSLIGIDLTSATNVGERAISCCISMKDATFGKELGSIGGHAFTQCHSLESITIPLKKGLMTCRFNMYHNNRFIYRV